MVSLKPGRSKLADYFLMFFSMAIFNICSDAPLSLKRFKSGETGS
jgi:hypothetical protein